jgi:hypothetical protein
MLTRHYTERRDKALPATSTLEDNQRNKLKLSTGNPSKLYRIDDDLIDDFGQPYNPELKNSSSMGARLFTRYPAGRKKVEGVL